MGKLQAESPVDKIKGERCGTIKPSCHAAWPSLSLFTGRRGGTLRTVHRSLAYSVQDGHLVRQAAFTGEVSDMRVPSHDKKRYVLVERYDGTI